MENTVRLLLLAFSFLALTGCCRPLLYEPTVEQASVFRLQVPPEIDSLKGYPRDETHVVNGVNLHTSGKQPDEIKEMFDLKNEYGDYRFTLYFNEAAAKAAYEFESHSSFDRVYGETKKEGISFLLYYVKQPRADPEGFCSPMNYYVSRAQIRIRNLVVRIETIHDKAASDSLTKALQHLSKQLFGQMAKK